MGHQRSGEDALHDIFRSAFRGRKDLPVGPGEDCALLRPGGPIVLTCDQVVAGVHLPASASPAAYARKLLGRTLSDLAAAGATPWSLAWTATVPSRLGLDWVRKLCRAFLAEARRYEAPVVGGDLSTGATVVLSCTALGRTGRRPPPGRGGARAGDGLWVTGRLGGAIRSGRHLRPEPRLAEGRLLVERYRAHALMDLSDGLARDLPRMLRASGKGARVDLGALPLARGVARGRRGWEAAVGDGEDYELLAALGAAEGRRAAQDPVLSGCGLQRIGTVDAARRRLVWEADGQPVELRSRGWEHAWK